MDNTQYVLEPDTEVLKTLRAEKFKDLAETERQKKYYNHEQMDNDPDFSHQLSMASVSVDDIQDFIFGGTNARFWMFRKHFNSMTREELKMAPFFNWQCISLNLGQGRRDIDLVISDDKHMDMFLKFLIHNLFTMNGKRDSARKLVDLMNNQAVDKYKRDQKKKFISQSVFQSIRQKNEHLLFRKVHLKYLILRVRAKISYMAFERRMTVAELIVYTIKKCYIHLMK